MFLTGFVTDVVTDFVTDLGHYLWKIFSFICLNKKVRDVVKAFVRYLSTDFVTELETIL